MSGTICKGEKMIWGWTDKQRFDYKWGSHKWFAWRSVKLEVRGSHYKGGKWVWLQFVNRVRRTYYEHNRNSYWQYEIIIK